jgi:FkbM family methyltransferase
MEKSIYLKHKVLNNKKININSNSEISNNKMYSIIKYNNFIFNIPKRYYIDNLKNRFKNFTYEKDEINMISKYFNKNDYVLELGSCLGIVSCLLSNLSNHVISIEANPELKDCLELTKKINNISNIDFHNCFISNNETPIIFQTYDLIVASSGNRTDKQPEHLAKTLRNYNLIPKNINSIKNIDKVNSIVLDIEGGELNFFNENQLLLNQCNKIMVELHQRMMNDINFNKKCIDILMSYGFILKDRKDNNFYFEKCS